MNQSFPKRRVLNNVGNLIRPDVLKFAIESFYCRRLAVPLRLSLIAEQNDEVNFVRKLISDTTEVFLDLSLESLLGDGYSRNHVTNTNNPVTLKLPSNDIEGRPSFLQLLRDANPELPQIVLRPFLIKISDGSFCSPVSTWNFDTFSCCHRKTHPKSFNALNFS